MGAIRQTSKPVRRPTDAIASYCGGALPLARRLRAASAKGASELRAQRPTYGARRVFRGVLERGQACGLHRIAWLMLEAGASCASETGVCPRTEMSAVWLATTS
jgi:hypothetical protein